MLVTADIVTHRRGGHAHHLDQPSSELCDRSPMEATCDQF